MIGVISLFGETDYQSALRTVFSLENIEFIAQNCITSVQLMDLMEEKK